MTEHTWKRDTIKALKQQTSVIVTNIVQNRYSHHGTADTHFNSSIWAGFVEFKGKLTPVKPAQKRFHVRQNSVRPYSSFVWRENKTNKDVVLLYFDLNHPKEPLRLFHGDPLLCLHLMSRLSEGKNYDPGK